MSLGVNGLSKRSFLRQMVSAQHCSVPWTRTPACSQRLLQGLNHWAVEGGLAKVLLACTSVYSIDRVRWSTGSQDRSSCPIERPSLINPPIGTRATRRKEEASAAILLLTYDGNLCLDARTPQEVEDLSTFQNTALADISPRSLRVSAWGS